MSRTWVFPGLLAVVRPPVVAALAALVPMALLALLPLGGGSVLAADPSPSPIVFARPQYLVWWDSHQTMDGPVVDKTYALFTQLPVEPGHFVVPDGNGGVFHYSGRVVGGPYSDDGELCAEMISLGIQSLEAWPPGAYAPYVDCAQYRAPAVPSATSGGSGAGETAGTTAGSDGGSSSGGSSNGGSSSGGSGEPSPEALDIAAGLIGILLFGGGFVGLRSTGGGPGTAPPPDAPPADTPPPDAPPPADPQSADHRPPDQQAPDPCADQVAALATASLRARGLNDLIQQSQRYERILEHQDAVLANLTIPGSVLLDFGFLAGSVAGGVGAGVELFAARTFWKAAGEALVKDVAKELLKQGFNLYGDASFDLESLGKETKEGGAKAYLLRKIRDSIVNRKFFGELSPNRPVRAARNMGEYTSLMKEMEAYGDSVAGPIVDALGNALDIYSGTMSYLTLKDQLEHLGRLRMSAHDARYQLELRLEDALGAMQSARERLDHCRLINAPGWQP